MAMFTPTSEWTPPTELPDLSEAKQIAVDVETRDPKIKTMGPGWARQDGEIVGYAVATEWWSGYVPVKHWGGGNLDDRIVRKWMQKVLATPADKIMHNAQYDLGWLRAEGFTVNGRIIDTMVVASLFDENRFSYSLNALCYDLLGKTKSEKALVEAAKSFGVDPKGEMWKLPAMHVGPYATTDAELALELWQYFAARIPVENLKTIFDLEMKLLPTLVDMTLRGVRVDLDRVERIKQHILNKEKDIKKQIRDIVGKDVEIWAGYSLARAFDAQNIAFPKTERGAPSFTKAFLAEHEHPLPQLIVQAREYNKINGTFIDSILRYVAPDGRIHGHINQIRSDDGGTVSGRISMNNPNMQQLPARHPELGPMIRSVFVPEEDEKWASIDYSQQEPRILVHYAEVFRRAKNISMPGVSEFVEGYRDNPDMDFHSMVAEMADIPRKQAKVINLAMMYGMGRAKLAAQLDISDEEAKELTDKYHDRVPFVKKLTKGVQMRLNDPVARGQIFSLRGRRCRFNLYEPEGFGMHKAMPLDEARAHYGPTTKLQRAMTYKALNRLIQASAADMTKQAMVDLADAGYLPLLQIHDELAFSVKAKEDAEKIAEIMEKSIELEVPMKTDIEMGDSWGDSM
jgi:DNA polymerase I-like protein with 3'-5' exonuclease and polymerase domains